GDPSQTTRFGDPGDGLGNINTVSFSAQNVTGTGVSMESVPIRIQSAVTDAPDLSIGNLGKGGTLQIQLKGFNDSATGSGNDADITGIDFTVTLYAGNNIVGIIVVSP